VPQVAVPRDLCSSTIESAQVCEYADLWHRASQYPPPDGKRDRYPSRPTRVRDFSDPLPVIRLTRYTPPRPC